MINTNDAPNNRNFAILAAFLTGMFVGCGAQRKGGESVKVDTVFQTREIVKNSVPRAVDSIPYSRVQQNGISQPQSREQHGLARPLIDQPATDERQQVPLPTGLAGQEPRNLPAYIFSDTFRSEYFDVATLDTVSDNRITGRKWWSNERIPIVTKTVTTEKKLPLLSLYGGAHATTLPAGTYYGPDVAISIRNNALIYANYTFVQNNAQYGIILKLSK